MLVLSMVNIGYIKFKYVNNTIKNIYSHNGIYNNNWDFNQ